MRWNLDKKGPCRVNGAVRFFVGSRARCGDVLYFKACSTELMTICMVGGESV